MWYAPWRRDTRAAPEEGPARNREGPPHDDAQSFEEVTMLNGPHRAILPDAVHLGPRSFPRARKEVTATLIHFLTRPAAGDASSSAETASHPGAHPEGQS